MAEMSRPLRLANYFGPTNVRLDLVSRTKPEAIAELLATLALAPQEEAAVLRTILRREDMGSTGIGKGVAVPHGRTPLVDRLRVAFGRSAEGIDYDAVDGGSVHALFLLIAPPVEVSNEYLPVLGRIAHLAGQPGIAARLAAVRSVEGFMALLDSPSESSNSSGG